MAVIVFKQSKMFPHDTTYLITYVSNIFHKFLNSNKLGVAINQKFPYTGSITANLGNIFISYFYLKV